ncbi:uncharacterized protein [Littorina saxatilis]|uniref:uncharacterized protein n=1 Tax=Littorina saxatilis TaxID=31220 RepID=UPI0038B56B01
MAGVTVFVVSHNKESRDVTLNNVMAHVTRAFSTFVRRTTDVLRYSMATNFADFQESMKKSIGNFSERLVAAINNNIRQKLTATSPAVIEAVENGTLPAVQAVRTSITVTQDKYEQALHYLVMYADTRFEDKVLASDVYRSFNNIFNKWREFRKTIKWKLRAFLRHLQDKIFGEMKKSTLEATGINDLLRQFGEQHEVNTQPVEEGINSLQRRISEKQDGVRAMRRYILATVSVFLAMSGAGCLLVAAIGTLCGPRSLDPSRVTEGHLLTHLAVNGIYIFLFITGWFLMIILTLVLVFVSLTQQFTCREINSLHVFGNVSNSTSDEQFFQNTLRACQTVTDFPTTLGVPVNARHDHRDLGHTSSTAAPVVTTVTVR